MYCSSVVLRGGQITAHLVRLACLVCIVAPVSLSRAVVKETHRAELSLPPHAVHHPASGISPPRWPTTHTHTTPMLG